MHSGILAYAIGKMDGIGGRKGWQWLAHNPLWMFYISPMGYTQDFYSRGYIDRHTVPHLIFHCTHLVLQGEICMQCHFTLLSTTVTLDFQAHAIGKRKTFRTPECGFRRSPH